MRVENGIIYLTLDECRKGLETIELALQANRLTLLDLPKDDHDEPDWLPRVQADINSTVYFDLQNIVRKPPSNPKALGYYIGMLRWAMELLETYVDRLNTKLEGKVIIEGPEDEIEEATYRIFRRMLIGDATDEEIDRLIKWIRLYLQKPYLKWPVREAQQFYRGLSQGLCGFIDENGQYSREKDNTRILISVWMCWPSVAQMKSVTQLYNWLCFLHGRQVIGEYKRIEKICQRHKITFRKPGRPKKTVS